MILVVLDNQNTKNEVTKICNEPGINVFKNANPKSRIFLIGPILATVQNNIKKKNLEFGICETMWWTSKTEAQWTVPAFFLMTDEEILVVYPMLLN